MKRRPALSDLELLYAMIDPDPLPLDQERIRKHWHQPVTVTVKDPDRGVVVIDIFGGDDQK